MFRKLLLSVVAFLFTVGAGFAQTGSLTGTVTDAGTGDVLPGANVFISELSQGASVGPEGTYEITGLPAGTYEVTVSYIGYGEAAQSVTITEGEETVQDFALEPGVNLDEVVVTALGGEVSENSVSFSSQEVESENLNIAQVNNIKSGLAGKVSGVQILGQAGSKLGAEGSIRIRGAASLTSIEGDPLYVVDGVPVDNPDLIDMGNVESMNVLKGPNATALYGQRGDKGVVILTTKSADQAGISVEVNSSTTFEQVAYTPNFQNQYGYGYNGSNGNPANSEWTTLDFANGYAGFYPYPSYMQPLDGERYIFSGYADESWGPEFDGDPYIAWYNQYPDSPYYGETATWDAAPNNTKNFYDTGITNKSSVAVNYTTDSYSARISFTNLKQGGIIPNSNLDKQFFTGRFNYDVTDDFSVGLNLNYTTEGIEGEVRNDSYGNQTSGSLNSWFGRQLEVDKMQELKDLETPLGYTASWNNWGPGYMAAGMTNPGAVLGGDPEDYEKPAFWYNPYTYLDRYNRTRKTDNILVNVNLSYQLTDQLELTGTANTTSEDFSSRYEFPYSLSFSAAPALYNEWVNSFGVSRSETKEHNFSSRLNYTGNFSDFSVDAFVGGQLRVEGYDRVTSWMDSGNSQNGGLIIPDVYNFGNSAERMIPVESNWNKKVISMFTKATIGYKDYLYLDGSYRRDYSSALPSGNNGYGYPSVGASFVFSELLDSDIMSYGKIRVGWAQVGNDVTAEAIDQTYRLQQDPYTNPATGQPNALVLTSSTLVDPDIKPALNSSFEVGADLRFFNDRLGLNATYYNETREDEIVSSSLSAGTGYSNYLTNAGSLEREGVELTLNGTPVVSRDFRWDVTVNWSTNKSVVTSLPEGSDTYELGANSSFGYISLTHQTGEEWGQLRGPGIQRNSNGEPVLNSSGKYLVEQNKFYGSVLADWTGGFQNTVSYKGISLAASIDFQKGGQFFSLSEQWGQYSGLLDETAADNELGNERRDPVMHQDGSTSPGPNTDYYAALPASQVSSESGGVYVSGVDQNGNQVEYYVNATDYYKQWQANAIAEPFIHDASYVKLRQVQLSYNLPKRWLGNFVQSAQVGVIGRNLWMIAVSGDNENGWDPSEMAEVYGENGQLPGTKSYGFNVKVTF